MVKVCRLHTLLDGRVIDGGVSVMGYKTVASAKGAMTAHEGRRPPIHDIDPVTASVFYDYFPKSFVPKAHGALFEAPYRKIGDIPNDARGIWFTEVFICEELEKVVKA